MYLSRNKLHSSLLVYVQHLHRIFVVANHCHMQRNPTLNHSCVPDQEQTQPVTLPHLCDLFWLPC
ncbi:hypothetical protein Hanom_Chr08g00728721 [Helianthus anomalus]